MITNQSKDKAHIDHFVKEINHMHQRYLFRMNRREFAIADQIHNIIKLYEQELSNASSDYAKDYGSQVSKTPVAGDKTVFIIKK